MTSGVNGQECEGSCTTEWDAGTDIELVADALPGFGFGSWTGACAGTADSTCFVELGATTEAGVVFRPLRRLALQITGRGTVTSSDVRCSRSCSTQRVEGTRAVLRAKAAKGWRFVRWSGACRGDSSRLHRPARRRRGKGRRPVRPARVTEPGLPALCSRWARCAC